MLQGALFTRDYLKLGIQETEAWQELDDSELASFQKIVVDVFDEFPVDSTPNEATTEKDLIFKVLEALGWDDFLPQQTASPKRRLDVPDVLFFATAEDKRKANKEKVPANRYRHGIAIAEDKPWQVPLDRAGKGRVAHEGVPSNQILRYLSVAEVQSERRIQWGILTNGRHWRLYYQGARSRSEEFLELDLAAIVGLEGFADDLFAPGKEDRAHWLKVFYLMFRREAFLSQTVDGRTFHQISLDEGRLWEERVAKDLFRPAPA